MTVCHGNYIEDQRNQTYLQMLFIVRDAYMIQGVIETVNLKIHLVQYLHLLHFLNYNYNTKLIAVVRLPG